MYIEKRENDFALEYEPDYDKREIGIPEIYNLVDLICNSIEMDFDLVGEGECDFFGITLFNYNTDKQYLVTHKDAEDFFKGNEILLYAQ